MKDDRDGLALVQLETAFLQLLTTKVDGAVWPIQALSQTKPFRLPAETEDVPQIACTLMACGVVVTRVSG
jgi:hypothetical protein